MMHRVFDKAVTIKQGQAPVLNYIDRLLFLVEDHKVNLEDIITHSLPLSDAARDYQLFDNREDD